MLKKSSCPLESSLRNTGSRIEVMSLEGIRVEGDSSFEFRCCFVITPVERECESPGSMGFGELVIQAQCLGARCQNSLDTGFQVIVQEQEGITIGDAGMSACIE